MTTADRRCSMVRCDPTQPQLLLLAAVGLAAFVAGLLTDATGPGGCCWSTSSSGPVSATRASRSRRCSGTSARWGAAAGAPPRRRWRFSGVVPVADCAARRRRHGRPDAPPKRTDRYGSTRRFSPSIVVLALLGGVSVAHVFASVRPDTACSEPGRSWPGSPGVFWEAGAGSRRAAHQPARQAAPRPCAIAYGRVLPLQAFDFVMARPHWVSTLAGGCFSSAT